MRQLLGIFITIQKEIKCTFKTVSNKLVTEDFRYMRDWQS